MIAFRIDPLAKAIIRSIKTEPERWTESEYRLLLDKDGDGRWACSLWKSAGGGRLTIDEPSVPTSWRSGRALWKALKEWRSTVKTVRLESNRDKWLAAIGKPDNGEAT